MATEHQPTIMERIHEHRVAITATAVSLMTVGVASASSIADNVTPIISDVASLMGPLLTLILSALPIIVVGAVISFLLGVLAAILGYIKI